MSLHFALYQPDIPQNTGTILRLCACLNVPIHIIHPTGFAFSDKIFRRSAMDYANHVHLFEHNNFTDFEKWRQQNSRRLILLSTKAKNSAYDFEYYKNDVLLAGRETAGVPQEIANICDAGIRIPMQGQMRSLNVAISCAMVLGEALRVSSGFAELD